VPALDTVAIDSVFALGSSLLLAFVSEGTNIRKVRSLAGVVINADCQLIPARLRQPAYVLARKATVFTRLKTDHFELRVASSV